VHLRRDLSYSTRTFATDGVVLVGDAAGFIDPFYSSGMDWITFTTAAAARLIADERRESGFDDAVNAHNRIFIRVTSAGSKPSTGTSIIIWVTMNWREF
jgi:2-polyprenyl-6-methoxyphenol hydroxylase-like FAD-dependent oxidoreductase